MVHLAFDSEADVGLAAEPLPVEGKESIPEYTVETILGHPRIEGYIDDELLFSKRLTRRLHTPSAIIQERDGRSSQT